MSISVLVLFNDAFHSSDEKTLQRRKSGVKWTRNDVERNDRGLI
jgi:hypothetical protein